MRPTDDAVSADQPSVPAVRQVILGERLQVGSHVVGELARAAPGDQLPAVADFAGARPGLDGDLAEGHLDALGDEIDVPVDGPYFLTLGDIDVANGL